MTYQTYPTCWRCGEDSAGKNTIYLNAQLRFSMTLYLCDKCLTDSIQYMTENHMNLVRTRGVKK